MVLCAFLLALCKRGNHMNLALFVMASVFAYFWLQPIGQVDLLVSNKHLCWWFAFGFVFWGAKAACQSELFKLDNDPNRPLPKSVYIAVVLAVMCASPILYDCAMSVVLAVVANASLAIYVFCLPIRFWWRRAEMGWA